MEPDTRSALERVSIRLGVTLYVLALGFWVAQAYPITRVLALLSAPCVITALVLQDRRIRSSRRLGGR